MGDLGPVCRAWIDELADAGTGMWQLLPIQPLGEAGEAGCPYLSPSAFALEETLISLDDLLADGLLTPAEIPPWEGPAGPVVFHAVRSHRMPPIRLAASRVRDDAALGAWRAANAWIEPWARYRAVVREHGWDWRNWPADPQPDALEVAIEVAAQFLVARQWAGIVAHARGRRVQIWGDMPIFVDLASCDVWERPALWKLDAHCQPVVVSGVPPDLFTPLGQKWGHPLYDVEAHRATGHAWWVARTETALQRFDVVRIDHFRGLAASWEVPARDPDARHGEWKPGLGAPLLEALVARFGRPLPLFAEDLGVITPDVEALRDQFGLPGMAVLQFGFDGNADNLHHPANHRENQVVYAGTHDTNTTVGWAAELDDAAAETAARQLGTDRAGIPEALIEATLASRADTAVVLVQDLLGLGAEARINRPGTWEGNWAFRLAELPSDAAWARWAERVARTGRQTVE
jgi:4-alpha-glucanotransferase